jgi:hypothetical protein
VRVSGRTSIVRTECVAPSSQKRWRSDQIEERCVMQRCAQTMKDRAAFVNDEKRPQRCRAFAFDRTMHA